MKELISVMIADLATLPLEIIKNNYQSGNDDLVSTVKYLYNKKSWKGFFASAPISLAGSVVAKTSKIVAYNLVSQKTQIKNKYINGLISSLIISLLIHPIDYIRINHQMNTGIKMNQIFNGYSKTCVKTCLTGTLTLPTYEYLNLKTNNPLLSSVLTTSFVVCVSQPLDYLKTREICGINDKPGDCRRGLGINLTKKVLNFSISMVILKKLKQ